MFFKAKYYFKYINVAIASNKFILAMMYSKVFLLSKINKSIIITPTIRMNDTINISAFPRIIRCNVGAEQSGTISV